MLTPEALNEFARMARPVLEALAAAIYVIITLGTMIVLKISFDVSVVAATGLSLAIICLAGGTVKVYVVLSSRYRNRRR